MSVRVGIVGATGAVGRELVGCLERRSFPVGELRLLASRRSAGATIDFRGEAIAVGVADAGAFCDLDVVLFSAGAAVSHELVPVAAAAGAVAIDNSSAFRMDDDVPLVVPEINRHALDGHQGVIANPNCSTIVMLMGLAPIHAAFGVQSVVASTYQAVSGAGAQGVDELMVNTRAALDGGAPVLDVFGDDIAFNVLPRIGVVGDDGETEEERKMQRESRKILRHPDLEVACTCVRVPVVRTHAVAAVARTDRLVDAGGLARAFERAAGVVCDDPTAASQATPRSVAESADVVVARLRPVFGGRAAAFVALGDQLLKGAALNAVQIAECLATPA